MIKVWLTALMINRENWLRFYPEQWSRPDFALLHLCCNSINLELRRKGLELSKFLLRTYQHWPVWANGNGLYFENGISGLRKPAFVEVILDWHCLVVLHCRWSTTLSCMVTLSSIFISFPVPLSIIFNFSKNSIISCCHFAEVIIFYWWVENI